jgi:hypothetical protein
MRCFHSIACILILLLQRIEFTMAGTLLNKKWILHQHPQGKFVHSRDAKLLEEPIDVGLISNEKIVVEVQALSVDAFIRTMVSQIVFFSQFILLLYRYCMHFSDFFF